MCSYAQSKALYLEVLKKKSPKLRFAREHIEKDKDLHSENPKIPNQYQLHFISNKAITTKF